MILINILIHHRFNFFDLQKYFFNKIKSENKDKIKIRIRATWDNEFILNNPTIDDFGIDCKVIPYNFTHDNYLCKIKDSIQEAEDIKCEYSISMDEDVFVNNHILDYMIENTSILENNNNLLLSPVISNGIPTCEYFINDFCTSEEKELIFDRFSKTYIPDCWGVNYLSLNNIYNIPWNADIFYSAVSRVNHYYRGIHPVRIDKDNQLIILEFLLKHIDKIIEKQNYYLLTPTYPYFCNTFYMIKTDIWKKIIYDESLFMGDRFDEVPLNMYRLKTKKDFVYIGNAFAIHLMYNLISEYEKYENYYYAKLKEQIII